MELNIEYRWRYGKDKDHASMAVLTAIDNHRFATNGLMPFAQAMPDEYKNPDDPVMAYRAFYCGEKSSFASWKKRNPSSCWLPKK